MAITVIQSEIATGDSTSTPITATLTGVVLRRWLLAFGACYNPGTMGASAFSDDQTSPANSWTNVVEEQAGADPFNLAFGAAKVANGGTVIGQLAPSAGRYPTYCLFEVDAPWNAQLNTPAVHEFTGSTLNFSFNAPPHATTAVGFVNGAGRAYPSTDWQAYLGLSWYSDDDPTAALVSDGWTVIRKQTNFSGLTQTLAVLSKSGSGTSGPTVNVATGIGGAIPAVAIGVILAAPPRVFATSNRTNGGGNSDVATDTLTFTTWQPHATDRIVIATNAWRTGTGGIDTTASMLSDNDGGAYDEDEAIAALTGRPEISGNNNTPGCGIYSRYLSADPATDPFTVTQDIDPGGALEGYWSWTAYCIGGTVDTSAVAGVSAHDPPTWPEFQPIVLGGGAQSLVKAGRLAVTWTHTIVITCIHNSFHEDEIDIADPSGYETALHNEENSLFLAGHSHWKFKLGDTADETPSMAVTVLSGSGVTYSRGIMVAYKLVEGAPVSSGAPVAVFRHHYTQQGMM